MVKSRRSFLRIWGVLVCCVVTTGAWAAPRPLVIVFAGGQATGPGVSNNAESEDKMAPPERSLTAARAVRDCFNLNGGVEASLYTPELPMFLRAAQEAKITLNHRVDLSEQEQIALSRTAGAVYLVQIAVQKASDGSGYEVRLVGYDSTGKKRTDRAGYVVSRTTQAGTPGDVNAITSQRRGDKQALDNAITSAANTLVARVMEGPLRDYNLADAAAAVPAAPIVPVAPVPLIDPQEAEAEASALTQASALISEKDVNGAISLLRRTVNQHPLSARARAALARAYLSAKRTPEALSEAKRGLLTADLPTADDREALTDVLQQAALQSGDRGGAQQVYEEVIAAQPDAVWARLALADLRITQGNLEAAETQYRAARQQEPKNARATAGLIRVLGAKGEFTEALTLLAPTSDTPGGKKARYEAATTLFDAAAPALANLLTDNRAAWEVKHLSREAFYRATSAQAQRAGALVVLLRSAPPVAGDSAIQAAYNKRVLAASLLAQASTALQTFLETGQTDAGAQANVWLTEFRKEMQGTTAP